MTNLIIYYTHKYSTNIWGMQMKIKGGGDMGVSMNIATWGILIILILSTLIFSGCIADEQESIDETPPSDIIEDGVIPDEVEKESSEQPEPSKNGKDDKGGDTTATMPARAPYTQQMNIWKYSVTPLNTSIYVGDSAQWFNNEFITRNGVISAVDEPYTLTSAQGLWEPVRLRYANKFIYTFNKSGIYQYYMPGYPSMNGTITVYEYNETTKGLYTSRSLRRGLIKVVPDEPYNATFVPKYLLNMSTQERTSGGIREVLPIIPNRLIKMSDELSNVTFVPKYLLNVSTGERTSGGIRETFPITPNHLINVSDE